VRYACSIVTAIWLLLAAAPLLAADPAVEALSAAGVPDARVKEIAAKTGAFGTLGILADPVVNKVREGTAKGATPDQIATAAARLADRMADAAALYAGHAEPAIKTPAVEAAAKAMNAGASRDTIAGLFESLGGSAIPRAEWHRPFGSLGSLIVGGAGDRDASRLVGAAVAAGMKPAEISAIPARLQKSVAAGRSSADAAGLLLDEIKGGNKAGEDPPKIDPSGKGLEKDDREGDDAEQSSLRGSGKGKYRDKSKDKKTPPGQIKK
jgi:hypothetical protein